MQQFQAPSRVRISGVIVKDLKVIADERGRLMEMMRSDESLFTKFGQSYITTGFPGIVKAWHYHEKQVDVWATAHGMIKLVLYDGRENSPTKGIINEFFMGEHHPILVVIPNKVVHGFKCIGTKEAIIVNMPTEVYDYNNPDEFRIPPFDPSIPYDWNVRCDG